MNAEDADMGDAVPSPVDAEISHLAALSFAAYQVERTAAASNLSLGVTTLDKLVKAERRRRRTVDGREHRSQPPPGPGEVRWPPGFAMKADGL